MIQYAHIEAAVTVALNVRPESLASPTRSPEVVLARQVIAYLCREHTTLSFPEIARMMGKSTHTSVWDADRRLRRRIAGRENVGLGYREKQSIAEFARCMYSDARKLAKGSP